MEPNNESKILILLSTYNGEKFVREQIDSILAQSIPVKLLIRDDGSTDLTFKILSEYQRKHLDKIDVIKGKNKGWRRSFFELLRIAKEEYHGYDYFAFADQDDIWLPDKLQVAIKYLSDLPEGPNLYCSNQYYYKNGENLGLVRKEKSRLSYKSCLVMNIATGCTMVFNRNLLYLINREFPTNEMAHDYWLYMVAILCGNIYVDENAYILYRQHENNQIGVKHNIKEIWSRRLRNLKKAILSHQREVISKELIRIFSDRMHIDGLIAVKKIANYRQSIINQFMLLMDNEYTLNKKENDFWLKVKILFRKL